MSDFVLFFDLKRAPAVIGMSVRWVREEIRRGMPCLDTGGKLLLDPIEVGKWMRERYARKPIDLAEAHRLAEALTAPRRRGGR